MPTMTQKRSRAAFESDSRGHHSPFIFCGTPLPPLDDEARDDGSYVPVWKQTVTDERGRKRLHGAFTGGFSAGYFNTVGSKEGWTPATFVSSRSNRHQDRPKADSQRPEDFMDEEDLAELNESRQLQTTSSFAGLGHSHASDAPHDNLFGLIMTDGDTIGVQLLQKMGWRRGQGIGPKVWRQARGDEGEGTADDRTQTEHLFAPEDTHVIYFTRKSDHKGLGYQGSVVQLAQPEPSERLNSDLFEPRAIEGPKSIRKPVQKTLKKSSFGVGVLNDTGSDDDDPYDMGPRISYKSLGGEKKAKKITTSKLNTGLANPFIAARPVFQPRKGTSRDRSLVVHACHDGRPPLDGFILSNQSIMTSDIPVFPPPKVPTGWKLSKGLLNDTPATDIQTAMDAAKSMSLDPKTRASILGETLLPGKSVFNFLSKEARDRIANLSGKEDLPQGLGEAPSQSGEQNTANKPNLRSMIPHLSKEAAVAALSKRGSGWMPYAEDLKKRSRYISFLELRAGSNDALPERAEGMTMQDWTRELQEFAHAAQVFKPVSGIMASRFTSSKAQSPADPGGDLTGNNLLHTPKDELQDPAVEAAHVGMYGPMTRSVSSFTPTRLLCKRLNVRPPAPAEDLLNEGSWRPNHTFSAQEFASTMPIGVLSLLPDKPQSGTKSDYQEWTTLTNQDAAVDIETNAALESARPGEEIFKAIFGSDNED
ncbi:DUF1604-domain-containing protein [Delitschia confertaspora ATCC 74209]|uniref:DUF1604-domain-containing protein n=1 Tax=Delitschia confertaspora ATCC 74209 TaxID=1513339 RepID=A0A9P4MTT8_9PLEO|nr:DUF1604-domain-containing protein [Delitschia confertaspora ATCC 74209]